MSELTEEKAKRQLIMAAIGGVILLAALIWGGYKLVQSDKKETAQKETETTTQTPATPDPQGPNPYTDQESETEPQDELAQTSTTRELSENGIALVPEQEQLPEVDKPTPIDDYSWTEINKSWAPIHPLHGPTQTEPFSTGFAKTPEGAALAFIHTQYQTTGTPLASYKPQIENHVVKEGHKKQLIIAENMHEQGISPYGPVFIGWDINEFTSDKASLSVYAANPRDTNDDYAVFPVDLVWQDDRWQVIFPEQGNFAGIVQLSKESPDFDLSGGLQ